MGQVLQEAGGQSGEIVPAGEHAVSGPHQRTVERAGPEQLLPQQCSAGTMATGHLQTQLEAATWTLLSRRVMHFLCVKGHFLPVPAQSRACLAL